MQEIVNSEQVKLMPMDINELSAFIVRVKAATYVGDGEPVTPCRLESHDLRFQTVSGRFLGDFEHVEQDLTYADASEGSPDASYERKFTRQDRTITYEPVYHGGLIRD